MAILPFTVEVWATKDNYQDDDKGKNDDDNIYAAVLATYADGECTMIGPYANTYNCVGMYLNWPINIVVINTLKKYSI